MSTPLDVILARLDEISDSIEVIKRQRDLALSSLDKVTLENAELRAELARCEREQYPAVEVEIYEQAHGEADARAQLRRAGWSRFDERAAEARARNGGA